MSGPATTLKPRTGPATTPAVSRGAEIPRNCGTSSPTTMEKTVTRTRATALLTDDRTASDQPNRLSPAAMRAPSEGWARYPTMRVVTVIPTCAAESWVDSARSETSTEPARGWPASYAPWTVGRSKATRENSAATKTAVPNVSPVARISSSHSVIAAHPTVAPAQWSDGTSLAPPGIGSGRRVPREDVWIAV